MNPTSQKCRTAPTAVSSIVSPQSAVPKGVLGTLNSSTYHHWKRLWELPLAALLAIPALSVTAILVLLVRLTSRGPGLYQQIRMGKDGKPFLMYKLRSMYTDAEDRGAQWCCGDRDPRITHVGRWLRKLHLDELPQIINVLRGDMSFCGPRPERPEFIVKLEECIPYYRSRLVIRPGITGFSQINLPPDTCLSDVHKKQSLDLEYVENATLLSDLKMVLCTAFRLVGVPGALATKLSGLTMQPSESRFSLIYDCETHEDINTPRGLRGKKSVPPALPVESEDLVLSDG